MATPSRLTRGTQTISVVTARCSETSQGGNKADIAGFTKRKILENIDNYEGAVEAFSTTPYVASECNIVAGVKKGVILARNPGGLAYSLPRNKSDKKYVLMTNFDHPWHDIKENFDPSVVKGRYRRKAAEKTLDEAKVLTPELLFDVLDDEKVLAKGTILQVILATCAWRRVHVRGVHDLSTAIAE